MGQTGNADEVQIVHGDVDARKFVAWYRLGDRLVGALGIASPPLVMRSRQLIEQRTSWGDALASL